MRAQTLIALASVFIVAGCEANPTMKPNGYGHKAEIPANVQQMIPENAFPLAKRYAGDCEAQKDLASCYYLGWILAEGMDVPPEHADETDVTITESYHIPEVPRFDAIEPNLEHAKALFQAACDGGWPSACVSLEQVDASENAPARFVAACAQGQRTGCDALVEIAAAGGVGDITADKISAALDAGCNDGRLAACSALLRVDNNIGQAPEPAAANPVHLRIQKSDSGRAQVTVYTDDATESNAVAQRAREAFGPNTVVEVLPAQGATNSDWLQSVPELLALAKGVPSAAALTFSNDALRLRTVITDANSATAVRNALTRIGGEDRNVVANLDPEVEEDAAEEAAAN